MQTGAVHFPKPFPCALNILTGSKRGLWSFLLCSFSHKQCAGFVCCYFHVTWHALVISLYGARKHKCKKPQHKCKRAQHKCKRAQLNCTSHTMETEPLLKWGTTAVDNEMSSRCLKWDPYLRCYTRWYTSISFKRQLTFINNGSRTSLTRPQSVTVLVSMCIVVVLPLRGFCTFAFVLWLLVLCFPLMRLCSTSQPPRVPFCV